VIDVERVDFISVPVTDVERAKQFYGETLGLEHEADWRDMGAEFRAGQVTVAVFAPEKIGREFKSSSTAIALRVPDVAAARATLEAQGVEFHGGETLDSGVCHMAFFSDPDGNPLILHRRHDV
jgi:predicted enzyme related to lactoylglutathione lyase